LIPNFREQLLGFTPLLQPIGKIYKSAFAEARKIRRNAGLARRQIFNVVFNGLNRC
jgi:hypothetical protein